MRELTKSAFTLPWALAMVGVQQIVNLVVSPAEGRVEGATAGLDAMTHAAEQHLGGWMDQALQIGDAVRRGFVDLTTMRAPSLDSSGLMQLATDRRSARLVEATSEYGLLPAAWLDSLRVAPEDRSAALRELDNKLRIIRLTTQMNSQLDLDRADDESLLALVERAEALETDSRLWGVEALGRYYGDRALEASGGGDPQDLLTDTSVAALPPWSLMMLHAGLGLSFATLVLAPLEPTSSRDLVRHGIVRFASLCRRSSRRGYQGAALASLGVAARSLYRNLVPVLDREIERSEPELREYFWHGAGRAMYFDATNMLPSSNAPRRMIVNLRQEAPPGVAYRNALSGIAWATTIVNMENPDVMEFVLRHHGVLATNNDAFANGVSSAIVVRYDTTPDDPHVARFVTHKPRTTDAQAAWRSAVTSPCQIALDGTYGELQKNSALGLLFHYRPSPA